MVQSQQIEKLTLASCGVEFRKAQPEAGKLLRSFGRASIKPYPTKQDPNQNQEVFIMYYAIETIGYGKRKRYAIVQVIPGKGTNPTTGCSYPTEDKARKVAADIGYQIEKVGDYWSII